MITNTFQLSIPSFGEVKGFVNDELAEVRGIPYAIVPDRFRSPFLCETLGGEVHDGTVFGPRCPQVYTPPELWIQETFPKTAMQPREYTWDEFKCTNLNISFPAAAIQNNSDFRNLPVMVNIHGGSYKVGSGNEPRHDGTGLVKGGLDIGKPVVVITLNWRHGYFGFLPSKELLEVNTALGDVSCGNYGLLDQRVALEWIHKHIQAFGGDPNNVTVFGNSSGAVSCYAHVQSASSHLVKRAIMQSGACIGCIRPLDINHKAHRVRFDDLTSALSISTLSAKEKVEILREVPVNLLIRLMKELEDPDSMFYPVADHDLEHGFFKGADKIDRSKHSLLVGNTYHDGYAFCDTVMRRGEKRCLQFLDQLEPSFRSIYLPKDDDQVDAWFHATCKFISDTIYAGANRAALTHCKTDAYSYVWARTNPISSTKMALHCTEMIYTSGLYLADLNEEDQALSRRMVERWIDFAYGLAPWKSRIPEGYDLVVPESGAEEVMIDGSSQYRRIIAEKIIAANISWCGDIVREFLVS